MEEGPDTPRFLDPAARQAVEARFGDQSADSSRHAQARLGQVLALLDTPQPEASPARRHALIATLCARAAAQRSAGVAGAIKPNPAHPALNEQSVHATDAFMHGASDTPVATLLGLLDAPPAAPDRKARLIERTLSAIQGDIEHQGRRLRMTSVRELAGARSRFNLRDLVASAAAVLIGAAIIWPSMTAVRASGRQAVCASNLQQAGMGMGLFTNAEDQRLPSIANRAEKPMWWRVGTPEHSHSANLFRLVAGGYTTMHSMACPCNECAPTHLLDDNERDWRAPEEVSYSYLLFEQAAPRISEPGLRLLLVDKSPVVERARHGEAFRIDLNSRNHGGRGQNALMADLSVQFLTSPALDGDNIWAPRSLEEREARAASTPIREFILQGTEQPENLSDIFVGP